MFVFHKKLFISHTKVSFKEPETDFSKFKKRLSARVTHEDTSAPLTNCFPDKFPNVPVLFHFAQEQKPGERC